MTDNTQPEALRLAEQYDYGDPVAHSNMWKAAVCTELRRQHARIAELEAELEALKVRSYAYNSGWKDGYKQGAWATQQPSPTPPAEQAAPKAAPWEQNAVSAEWLEQAYREGWAACRDAETIGEEAESWAFGNSTANSRMIDAQQTAPQQEAQEPVALLVRKNSWRAGQWEAAPPDSPSYGLAWANQRQYVYAAPQPAPDCHHRPPCAECAARARLREKT